MTMFGVRPALGGELMVDGQSIVLRTPSDAVAAGIALVPEDRKQQGLILDWGLPPNVGLAVLDRDARRGVRDGIAEKELSERMRDALSIKVASDEQPVGKLSGGNQQKVCIAKWLALEPRVLLLDEPTRGIDVGAREEIYGLIDRLAEQGVAILFASSDMEEVLQLSDRVLVMHEGKLAGELTREQANEESIMRLATGGAA